MKGSTSALTVALLTSMTLAAGCGKGSTESSGNASPATAALSVDLVDAPVDGAANVFIRVKGLILHGPESKHLVFRYCADTEPVVAPENGEEITDDTGEVSRQPTMRYYADIPDDSASESAEVPAEGADEAPTEESEEVPAGNEPEPEETVQVPEQTPDCVEPEIREIDLLALTGGVSQRLLDDIEVPVGDYSWVRLELDEDRPGYIVLDDGATHDLTIPGAMNTGLKLVSGFAVEEGGSNQILIDFDLRKSIHKAGPNYRMRPTLRLLKIRDRAKQQLAGEWSTESMGQCDSPMAYVYAGADVLPDDIGGTGEQPLTTAAFVAHEDGTKSTYRVDFIDFGDYTVSYVCNGATDEPESDDELDFVQTATVTIAR